MSEQNSSVDQKAEQPKPETIEKYLSEADAKVIEDMIQVEIKKKREFSNASVTVVKAQERQKTLFNEIGEIQTNVQKEIEKQFKKMELDKYTNYRWNYEGNGKFVGYKAPEPKKTEPVVETPKEGEKK